MKIEKLPSGSYRARKTVKGKQYTIILPYKPDNKELTIMFADKMKNDNANVVDGTFLHYAKEYIASRSNVVSPATVRTYNIKINQLSDDFKAMKLYGIDQQAVQTEINKVAATHSPKTVRTLHGFIASVLALYKPDLRLKTTLPMVAKSDNFIPEETQIKALLTRAKGTPYSIAFQLGVLGLRRGEICAAKLSDLNGNELHIHRDIVYDENNKWIEKETPKTDASNRTVILPDKLVEEIKEAGCIYEGHPNALNKAIHRYQKELKIPSFKFHLLRAYFVSYAHTMGISDQIIMSIGGWSTDSIMKSTYRKTMQEERKKSMQNVANKLLN